MDRKNVLIALGFGGLCFYAGFTAGGKSTQALVSERIHNSIPKLTQGIITTLHDVRNRLISVDQGLEQIGQEMAFVAIAINEES